MKFADVIDSYRQGKTIYRESNPFVKYVFHDDTDPVFGKTDFVVYCNFLGEIQNTGYGHGFTGEQIFSEDWKVENE